jgi:serine/threonine-protein kinase
MSTVYKAYDPNLQRPVAVKLIHPHLSRDPEFVRRFEREAAAVAKLRHANIIQVYDFDHDDDIYYMVLDYIPGRTLKEWLRTLTSAKGRLPAADAVRIMTAVCDAVAYAHEQGIIHRDLKPANIMLTPKGQPILMDFGVTKMLDGTDHTATGTIVGTAKYMAPEQARGERPDARSDIYALGVMLYELLAGQPPFEADTTVAVLMKHVNEPVPDIRQIQSDVPDELVEIIETALAKDRHDRYQNAAHMSTALKLLKRLSQTASPAAGAQSTVRSRLRESTAPAPARSSSSPATPVPAALRQKPVLWAIGVLTILVVLILGLGGFFILNRLLLTSDQAREALALAVEQNLPSSKGMTRIEGQVYTVGLDGPDQDHLPPRPVELGDYWIDQYEVNNAQFAEFLAATDRQPPAAWPEGNLPAGQEKHPVKGLTWETASAYCEWANKRLPTEAEWEVAARGPEGRLYPWGDKRNAVELPRSGTYEVGSKVTNQSPFGVFDMAGNVWEWVGQTYSPVAEGHRVLRGGANDLLKDMAFRLEGAPDLPTMIASAGVRCAADEVHVVEVEEVADSSVLYQDSFANPGSGWPILSEGELYFGYHPPDYYHFEIGVPDKLSVISRPPNFGDVTVEAEVLVDHTDTDSGSFRYGLVLRQTGRDQYYAFTVSSRQGSWAILKSTTAGLETLAEGTVDTLQGFAPPGFTPDKTDTLRVDASGPHFVFTINGQRVAQVKDSVYTSGEVGFFSENFDETLSHVHFDALTIRSAQVDQSELAQLESVFYEDSFADPDSGWPVLAEDTRLFGYHPPDFYHVESSVASNLAVISRQPAFDDVTVESDILVDHTDTGDGDFRYGLALRRTGEDQYYAFAISSRQGSWQVLKSSPAGLETLAEGEVDTLQGFAPAGFTPDKTDTLAVEASGPNFVFSINGESVAEVNDSDYASGEVGFFVETLDETLAHVHFDTLTIR